MKQFVKPKIKLFKAEQGKEFRPYAITQQQRQYEIAHQRAGEFSLHKAIEFELGQLFNDSQFAVDINLCSHSTLQSWLAEAKRVFFKSAVFEPIDADAYIALDYTSAHRMADLCLGGDLSQANKTVAEEPPAELTRTESRICARLLQKQVQGIQELIFKERACLLAEPCSTNNLPSAVNYLAFKVRLILDNDVISWFIWLPVAFFSQPQSEHDEQQTHLLNMEKSSQFLVRGHVEMARKKVTLRQLKAALNGEVLPIQLSEPASFKLGNKTFFTGQIVQQDASLTFQITDNTNKE